MEKMMLAIGRLKEGEGKFEKFMAFFQSEEGMEMRKAAAHVEKTGKFKIIEVSDQKDSRTYKIIL